MTFNDFAFHANILQSLQELGYQTPTPIQVQAMPFALQGRDVLGCAQTGTGKTAAFALPIIQQIINKPIDSKAIQALILAPTRELALQIQENIAEYTKHTKIKSVCIFGGVPQKPQVDALKNKPAILVATPGRLIDLQSQGYIKLNDIQYFVLDEADRMLDMGFLQDIKRLMLMLPHQRQTLFFSATIAPAILSLAKTILTNPASVQVSNVSSTATTIKQQVYFVDKKHKSEILYTILKKYNRKSTIVFTKTKHGANRLAENISKQGIFADAFHSNKSQVARQKALDRFKKKEMLVLVATDIASRGIDIDDVGLVVNYDIPDVSESYVHRIGRSGRAEKSGLAIALVEEEDLGNWDAILKLIKQDIEVIKDHPYPIKSTRPEIKAQQQHTLREKKAKPKKRNNKQKGNRGGRGNAKAGNKPSNAE
jgi:ATP-dependent RNA helicase RhlE